MKFCLINDNTYKYATPTIGGTALFRGETAILTGDDSSGRAA